MLHGFRVEGEICSLEFRDSMVHGKQRVDVSAGLEGRSGFKPETVAILEE